MSFADRVSEKAGRSTKKAATPVARKRPEPAQEVTPPTEVRAETDLSVRDRAAELERTGRRHVTMYFGQDTWRRVLDMARAEDTNGATVVEVLVDQFLAADAATRTAIFEDAREITAERRRRR